MINQFIHIFTAGTYPQWDSKEQKTIDVTVSPENLAQIAASYDPVWHEAPLWIGHPLPDAPALGWFSELKAVGDKLYAKLSYASDELIRLVKAKSYKKVSVEIYNWKKDGKDILYLGAIGLTNLPLIKNLPELNFSNKEGALAFAITNPKFSFPITNPIKTMNEAIKIFATAIGFPVTDQSTDDEVLNFAQTKLTTLQTEVSQFAEHKAEMLVSAAIDSGKILPKQKESYLGLAKTNYTAGENLFSEMKPAAIFSQNIVSATPPKNLDLNQGSSAKFAIPEDRKSWNYNDWQTKDPKGLLKKKAEDPDL